MTHKLKILIVGPQASGKGTQAEIMSKKFNLPIFSAGNLLRQRIQQKDELGVKMAEIMKAGKLVSDDLVNEMIAEKIEYDGQDGYILDGYPRNMYQAKFFDDKYELTHVIEINISDKEAIRRMSGRRTCKNCQAVYHIEYSPSKVEGICDKCGGELVMRDDDKPEAIKERLGVFHRLTEPMVEYYKKKGIYSRIDGEQEINKVSQDIFTII